MRRESTRLPAVKLVGLLAVLASSGVVSAQVYRPITPGITVEIGDVIRMPDTRGQGPEDSRSGNNYARINFMQEVPGDPGKWFVNDLRGQVYRVDPTTQSIETYLDMRTEFSNFVYGPGGLSTGLIAITPHPDFASNGKFYTLHEERASGNPGTPDFVAQGNAGNLANGHHGVLVEWTASDPNATDFTGSRRELMRVAQPGGNIHNLADIVFNPLAAPGDSDYGVLYVGGGDGGYDSYNRGTPQAQNLSSLFGKILRIDPAGTNSANGAYGVPADNPYAADGNPATLGEIYASGFRNAHRLTWDAVSNRLLTADVGQNNIEEVNIVEAGGNYGWSVFEGTYYEGGLPIPRNENTGDFVWPVAQYDHGDGDAIAGGFVYRGTQIPALVGKFVYGDITTGRLFYSDLDEMIDAHTDGDFLKTAEVFELFITQDRQPVSIASLVVDALDVSTLPNQRVDLRFGQISDGEIYVMTKQDGWIRQLLAPSHPGDFNGDGRVDAADYTVWRDASGSGNPGSLADANRDGSVDELDYAVWKQNYGQPKQPDIAAVPEPHSLACVAMLALLCVARRKPS